MAGLIQDTRAWYRDPYGFLDRKIASGELTFRINLPGLPRALMTGEPELIEEILRTPTLAGGLGMQFVQPLIGPRSLITLHGKSHESRRRVLMKWFFDEDNPRIKALTATHFQEQSRHWRGRTFSLLPELELINLRVIIDYVLGPSRDSHAEFLAILKDWLQSLDSPLFIFAKPLQIEGGGLLPWGKFVRKRQRVLNWIRDHLRRKNFGEDSILKKLAAADELALSEDDIVWECVELLLFGHDTSAAGVAWALGHLLASDPARAEKIRDSKDDALLLATIQETLRITPIVIHLTRQATENAKLQNQWDVRRGDKVLPCMYLAHHHPRVFPESYRFMPERFLNESEKFRRSFFPFGFGQRLCIGMPFALAQMKFLLRELLTLGSWQLPPDTAFRTVAGNRLLKEERRFVIMAPRHGLMVKLL